MLRIVLYLVDEPSWTTIFENNISIIFMVNMKKRWNKKLWNKLNSSNWIRSIPDRLSSSFVFIDQASIALLEIKASSVDSIQWFSISAGSNVVRTFRKTVAAVIAKSAKSLIFLKPQYQNLEISEFSSLLFSGDAINAHHIHQCTLDIIFFAI